MDRRVTARGAEHQPPWWFHFAIDYRSTRHEGYAKLINSCRGTEKVSAVFGLYVIAYTLIRLGNLLKSELAVA